LLRDTQGVTDALSATRKMHSSEVPRAMAAAISTAALDLMVDDAIVRHD